MKCALLALAGLLAMTASAHAYKQEDLDKLKETRKCVGCDLSGADLSGANLSGANLREADLSGANLRGAILIKAKLGKADLRGADLRKAVLRGADLIGANLSEADLIGANLRDADLRWAILRGANLSGALLRGADLIGTNLREADLIVANLREANLIGANLREVDLSGAILIGADLSEADLRWGILFKADLSGAELREAILREANLRGANLSEAVLFKADLRGADLRKANLSRANLRGADLREAVFEPKSRQLPDLLSIRMARNLHKITFSRDPDALVAVRKAFKEAGRRDLERQITYAIKRKERINTGGIEGAFNYILFEITSEYGMSPGRPLRILFVLIVVFSVLYMQSVYVPEPNESGMWRVWPDDRVHERKNDKEPERVDVIGHRVVLWGLYFSLLSAFHIGWRDLNVGNWIARIHPKEFALRATGWVKVVSGIQSLISVYLIALWALTYFGRPFE